jgi:hypothetical protein
VLLMFVGLLRWRRSQHLVHQQLLRFVSNTGSRDRQCCSSSSAQQEFDQQGKKAGGGDWGHHGALC